jgi:hypothetical protein
MSRRGIIHAWSLASGICVCVILSACKSTSSPSPAANDGGQLLVGSWASVNNTREYKFESNGKFSFTIDPQRCPDALPSLNKITASGTWKREGTILALIVDNTSDAILNGSTMRETLVTVDPNALTLSSSLAVCGTSGAEEVQLRKR